MPALGLLYASSLAVWREGGSGEEVAGPVLRAVALAGIFAAAASWIPSWLLERWENRLYVTDDPPARLELARRGAALAPAIPLEREAGGGEWLNQKPARLEEALFQLRRAEELSPQNAGYLVIHAQILMSREAWPQVLKLSGRALELEPDLQEARQLQEGARSALKNRGERLGKKYRKMRVP